MNQLAQMDLESEMIRICQRMEDDVDVLAQVSTERAEAEADYKHKHARALIDQTDKMPVGVKDAMAHLRATEDYRRWKLLEAREKATQQSLVASRSRLDALRTICANVRALGG